jgi:hypothetical protein
MLFLIKAITCPIFVYEKTTAYHRQHPHYPACSDVLLLYFFTG